MSQYSLRTGLFFVLLICSTVCSADPPSSTPSQSLNNLPPEQAYKIVSDALRELLRPRFEELLALPEVHILASPKEIIYNEPWKPDEDVVTFYYQEYRFDIPFSELDHSVGNISPFFIVSSPRFALSKHRGISFKAKFPKINPYLKNMGEEIKLPKGLPADYESFLQRAKKNLNERFDFENDVEVYRKMYSMGFCQLKIENLDANDLLEYWALLELKSIAIITGTRGGFSFMHTPQFNGFVAGPSNHMHGFFFCIEDDQQFVYIHLSHRRSEREYLTDLDDIMINGILTSIRHHHTKSPGRKMRMTAAKMLKRPRTTKTEMLARTLLVLSMQYSDDIEASRKLLRSTLHDDMELYEEYQEFLLFSQEGRCLSCGLSTKDHGKEYHHFIGQSKP